MSGPRRPGRARRPDRGRRGLRWAKAVQAGLPEVLRRHNHYVAPDVDTGAAGARARPPTCSLGCRWDGERLRRRCRSRSTRSSRATCKTARRASPSTPAMTSTRRTPSTARASAGRSSADGEPVPRPAATPPRRPTRSPGLDTNDEVVFMASDAGAQAPAGRRSARRASTASRAVTRPRPATQRAGRYVYVDARAPRGPSPSTRATATSRYTRDANADTFEKSRVLLRQLRQRCARHVLRRGRQRRRNADGTPRSSRRRPRDFATITTDRYRYRYDGRWLMTKINIADEQPGATAPTSSTAGRRARSSRTRSPRPPAAATRRRTPTGAAPPRCSASRAGPVRTIRETWGADSGTNVIRRETFYRDEMTPEDLAARARDPAAGRHLRAVGLQRRPHDPLPQPAEPGRRRHRRQQRRGRSATSTTRATKVRGQRHQRRRPGLPRRSTAASGCASLAVPPERRPHATRRSTTSTPRSAGRRSPARRHDRRPHHAPRSPTSRPAARRRALVAVPYYRDDSCFDDATGSNPGPR